jgi:hypothetical protein
MVVIFRFAIYITRETFYIDIRLILCLDFIIDFIMSFSLLSLNRTEMYQIKIEIIENTNNKNIHRFTELIHL